MLMMLAFSILTMNAQINDTITLNEVSITSFYQTQNVESVNTLDTKTLTQINIGQEPSYMIKSLPSIFSFSDNGTEFGYGYFRLRGLDQTRVNATLDGMPWNEAEDFGMYFANSPDIMSSMHEFKVERGSVTGNGIAGYVGGVSLESTNLGKDTVSYATGTYGSFDTWHTGLVFNTGYKNDWANHIKMSMSQTNGYKDNAWNKSQAFTWKTGYKFNDRHQIEFLSLNGQHRNCQAWLGVSAEELAENPRANGNTKDETDHWIQSVNKLQYTGWFSDNFKFTSSAYLQFQTGEYRFDLDNYMHRICGDSYFSGYLIKDTLGNISQEYLHYDSTKAIYDYGLTHYLYGNMSAMQWYVTDNFKLNAGYNVYRYQRRHYMDNTLDIVNVIPKEYYDKNDLSGFVSGTYEVSKFTFNGNIQYRYVDFNYKEKLRPYEDNTYTYNTKWNFVNGGASVEYATTNNSKVYARYELTHREPTRTDMFNGNEYMPTNDVIGTISGNDTIPNSEYGNPYVTTTTPEMVNDFEIGYSINNKYISGNLNLFYMDFTNERVLNGKFGLNGLPEHETVGQSYRAGVELSANVNIGKHLVYGFNGSWSTNKMKTSQGVFNHILTPTWIVNNDITWKGNNWSVGISQLWHDKMYVNMDNSLSVPDYFTLNLHGNYRVNNIELGVRLNDITNRTNYYYGAEGPEGLLYFQEAKFSAFGDIKVYF